MNLTPLQIGCIGIIAIECIYARSFLANYETLLQTDGTPLSSILGKIIPMLLLDIFIYTLYKCYQDLITFNTKFRDCVKFVDEDDIPHRAIEVK